MNRPRRAAFVHALVAVLLCVVLPGGSYVVGDGALAYPMFVETRIYQLRIRAFDADGRVRDVPPILLAKRATGATALYFAGLESPRRGPKHDMPRRFLPEIAALACDVAAAARVEVTLSERARPEAEAVASTIGRTCAR